MRQHGTLEGAALASGAEIRKFRRTDRPDDKPLDGFRALRYIEIEQVDTSQWGVARGQVVIRHPKHHGLVAIVEPQFDLTEVAFVEVGEADTAAPESTSLDDLSTSTTELAIDEMTVLELQAALAKAELKTSGKKADLVARLKEEPASGSPPNNSASG